MSLAIYLDDCAFSYHLRELLLKAGHQVQIPAEVEPSLMGAADEAHFAHACASQQVLLTFNAADFHQLHHLQPKHPGILVVYQDNDPSRDMSYADMVRAIANLEQSGVAIAGGFWPLNAYRW